MNIHQSRRVFLSEDCASLWGILTDDGHDARLPKITPYPRENCRMKIAYGEDVVFSGPTLRDMLIEKGRIRLRFDHLGSGLWVKGQTCPVTGFEIAGSDKHFVRAEAYPAGIDIVVYSEEVAEPVAVRYNWSNMPEGNLYNREGLPAPPFRTDDWDFVIPE